jgi:hypothetical protein
MKTVQPVEAVPVCEAQVSYDYQQDVEMFWEAIRDWATETHHRQDVKVERLRMKVIREQVRFEAMTEVINDIMSGTNRM